MSRKPTRSTLRTEFDHPSTIGLRRNARALLVVVRLAISGWKHAARALPRCDSGMQPSRLGPPRCDAESVAVRVHEVAFPSGEAAFVLREIEPNVAASDRNEPGEAGLELVLPLLDEPEAPVPVDSPRRVGDTENRYYLLVHAPRLPRLTRPLGWRMLFVMIALRLLYTAAVMVVVIWLLRTGNPAGGLLLVPAAAVWLRREAESGRLAARIRGTLPH